MLIVGADNAFGWRITVALAGLATVALVWFIAKRMFRSVPWAAFAAFLIAIDGHAIVLSRITILDGILVMFVLLGFLFMLYDRDDQRAKIAAGVRTWWLAQDAPLNGEPTPAPVSSTMEAPAEARRGPNWGPRLWNRPWLMAAAAAFACASAVKWSGLYFLAAFCVYSLVIDLLERRRQGVTLWASAGILMQGPISFILTIPLAAAIYLATWIPWLTTTGGYYRTWAEQPGKAWEGLLSWVPLPLQSLWHYQVEAYKFHTTLDATHPYQSSSLGWPFLARPTAFSYDYFKAGDGSGCTEELCVEAINSISNPLIWWIGTAAILVLLVLQFRRPSWRAGMILVGYGAGYLPWLAVLERQAVFHFYAIVMLGFMVLAIVEVLRTIVGTKEDPRSLRTASLAVLFIGIGVVTLVSALFYPIWTGIQIPDSYWRLTQWLPTWK
nr:phospholipid carrier-dependent glycosyltransferase [Pseudoclavibacter alba]